MSLVLDDYAVAIAGRTRVSGISLTAEAGEVVAVLGPNGAGKSTLMKGLCGLRSARGVARLGEVDLLTLSPAARARMVGYVAQDLAHLDVQLSIFELMILAQNGGRRSWRAAPDSARNADAILDHLGLAPFARRRPADLSGGERQMIGLALALVRRPHLLLLDEPTSALDLANQLHMLHAVADYTRRHRIVTLMIVHDLNLATRFSDRCLMLAEGRARGYGPTRAVLTLEALAEVFGIECRSAEFGEEGFTAIYPVAVTRRRGAGRSADHQQPGSLP